MNVKRKEQVVKNVFFTVILFYAAIADMGCVPASAVNDTNGNSGVDPNQTSQRAQGEPNDSFDNAVKVLLNEVGQATLQGTITTPDDVDVYNIGPMFAGDRLVVGVSTPGNDLDSMLAVFDELGNLVFENDDRNVNLDQLDPFLNNVIRHDSLEYFIAIARAPFDTSFNTGSYEVLVTVIRGGQVPPTSGQIIVLDYDGGSIRIPGDRTYTVGEFYTDDISPLYAGMTAEVRNQITATVEENFEGLDLDVRQVPVDSIPSSAGSYSFVLFGGRNPEAYGISQGIDSYNNDKGDGSIVFTEMFTPARSGRVLSATELGIAIGNIATHEVGHLLGLNHVTDVFDIMDTTGDATTFLLDQEFIRSPLDDRVFPIGWQDGYLLLLETLGAI